MKILIVDGFGEDEIATPWSNTLAATLRQKCHLVTVKGQADVSPGDYVWVDAVIAYSWGVASTWSCNHGSPDCELLVIIAGVPKTFDGQWAVWTAGGRPTRAVAFTLDLCRDLLLPDPGFRDAVASGDIANGIPAGRVVNVGCDSLGVNHVSLPGNPILQAAIVSLIDQVPLTTEGKIAA